MCRQPKPLGKTFDDAGLREVVEGISPQTGLLIQSVNFSVEISAPAISGLVACPSESVSFQSIDIVTHINFLCIDLSKRINTAQLTPNMLVGQYVPNLIAEPLQVTL
jgi:hypothetical protein